MKPKKEIRDEDIPGIIHCALEREAELLVKAIRAFRRDLAQRKEKYHEKTKTG